MQVPTDLLYTEEHEWVKIEDDLVTIGITDFAQGELGDVVFVELPSVEDKVGINDVFGTIEAVKAVSDLFAPLSGKVVEVNEALADTPEIVNKEPYGDGWMIKIRLEDESELNGLLSPDRYEQIVG